MSMIERHRQQIGTLSLCQALEIPRASFYRQQTKNTATPLVVVRKRPEHALSDSEQQTVLATLHEPHFVDLAPPQVYAQLLEEGQYLCSIRTMYRLLAANHEVRERRAVASRVVYTKPELLATRPNEVWSWDITKLKGPVKWTYYYLYVILDIFSRYVVGWMIAANPPGSAGGKESTTISSTQSVWSQEWQRYLNQSLGPVHGSSVSCGFNGLWFIRQLLKQ